MFVPGTEATFQGCRRVIAGILLFVSLVTAVLRFACRTAYKSDIK